MKVTEKTIAVELNEQEIAIITHALHHFYKEQQDIDYDNANDARILRNEFGQIVGRFYMGDDA